MTNLRRGMTEYRHSPPYRGRFAPSPTGPLHFGSLIAAVGSYLMAKSQQGEWFVRIDDIDPPREIAGASDNILRTLETFGFEWDGEVSYQSQHYARYQAILEQLQRMGLVYPCACTRSIIATAQRKQDGLTIYPGTCREGLLSGQVPRMQRLNTVGAEIEFEDRFRGMCQYKFDTDIGDFVLLRADGLFSYQLATGVDDAEQGMTEVIRGNDLLDSTPCQILIQQYLGLPSPCYGHLPVMVNSQGQKLSKQNLAPALDTDNPQTQLWQALRILGQNIPEALARDSVKNIWQWAVLHWQASRIPLNPSISV